MTTDPLETVPELAVVGDTQGLENAPGPTSVLPGVQPTLDRPVLERDGVGQQQEKVHAEVMVRLSPAAYKTVLAVSGIGLIISLSVLAIAWATWDDKVAREELEEKLAQLPQSEEQKVRRFLKEVTVKARSDFRTACRDIHSENILVGDSYKADVDACVDQAAAAWCMTAIESSKGAAYLYRFDDKLKPVVAAHCKDWQFRTWGLK